jgi:hypothetical protein
MLGRAMRWVSATSFLPHIIKVGTRMPVEFGVDSAHSKTSEQG